MPSYTNDNDFDLIECFTTTFLRTHSWLNWVEVSSTQDGVGKHVQMNIKRTFNIQVIKMMIC